MNRRVREEEILELLDIKEIISNFKDNPKTKYKMKNGRAMAATYLMNKLKSYKVVSEVKHLKRRL